MEYVVLKFLHTTFGTEAFYRKGIKVDALAPRKTNIEPLNYNHFR